MIGIVGCGAMGGAICKGLCKQTEVGIYDIVAEKCIDMQTKVGAVAFSDCAELIARSEMVILAVKPNMVANVLESYREDLAGRALISIAAGWTADQLKNVLDRSTRVLCAMPNTAALVGESMTAFSTGTNFTNAERQKAETLFRTIGQVEWVSEAQLSGVIGVSGSGIAYAYMFLQALADGGVEAGLSRALSLQMAMQTLKGAAEMAARSGMHPEELKDMVCSPGGTTIAAVHALEKGGLRGTVMDAVQTAAEKAGELSK